MSHKPPTLPATPYQLTLDRFFTKKHTNSATQQPANKNRKNTPTPPKKETTNTSYRHPAIHAVTFNLRGIYNTILDLRHIFNSKHKPRIINLTETKHSHIKSIWRDTLKEYKLIHTHPKLDPNTLRRSAGTILATRRDVYKEATPIKRRQTSWTT
jgi:hypothetical protein